MNVDRPMTALRVPTLTEVVSRSEPAELDVSLDDPMAGQAAGGEGSFAAHAGTAAEVLAEATLVENPRYGAAPVAPATGAVPAEIQRSEAEITQRVLADVQRQVELMLEYRMREALAPILARATDMLIRDTRKQLANTLHEMVAQAVAQEMSRHRDR